MKTTTYLFVIFILLLSGCESEPISESLSIHAEKMVGKWRLGETLAVREFTEDGLAFVYNIEEGRGELVQYFDADESTIRYYKEKDLSGESHGFPYRMENDSLGIEHLILTFIHPEGQGYIEGDYFRIQ